MDPSHFLLTLVLTGILGSITLVAVFIGLLSVFVKCPGCDSRTLLRARHCHQCGIRLPERPLPIVSGPVVGPSRIVRAARPGSTMDETNENSIEILYQRILDLDPEQRGQLNRRLRDRMH